MFFKITVLKNFTNFTGKHLCCNLSLRKLQAFKLQLYKKETPTQMFSFKLHEIFINALSQSISDGCFWQFQNSSLQLYLKIDPGTSCWISTSRYSKKYLKYSSIRTRSSHSKMFIYLKSLKIFCEEVNSYWSCEMPPWKFTKKALSHIFLHAFCLHFLRRHHNYFLWRDFEGAWAQFLSGKISEKWCHL